MTPAFGGQYSIQLSYGRFDWAAYSTVKIRQPVCFVGTLINLTAASAIDDGRCG